MSEQFINEIYTMAECIPEMKKIIRLCRIHDGYEFNIEWKAFAEKLAGFCRTYAGQDPEAGQKLWDDLQTACSQTNGLSFMGTLLEEKILPQLYEAMSPYCQIDVTDAGWRLVSSRSGFLSIQNSETGEYIHSMSDPVDEAYELAGSLYKCRNQRFFIIGGGLGYLAMELYRLSEESLDIYIFEPDPRMVEYARAYGVLDDIPEEHLKIYTGMDSDKLVDAFCIDSELGERGYIGYHVESYAMAFFREKEKEQLQGFRIVNETARRFGPMGERNFERNVYLLDKFPEDIKLPIETDRWNVIAAGPSLDDNMDLIRELQGKEIIIAVSTCLKKLLNAGIKPDFVAVLDPQNRTFRHMNGVERTDIPMLIASSANWQFAQNYKGDKYLIPVKGITQSDEHFELSGHEVWNVGSTVTSLALEAAARLGAGQIRLIGADLAYPSGKDHASGTMDCAEVNTDGRPMVKSVDGGMVATDKNFMIYISEIEEQIKAYPCIRFINMSEHGALIRGAEKGKK